MSEMEFIKNDLKQIGKKTLGKTLNIFKPKPKRTKEEQSNANWKFTRITVKRGFFNTTVSTLIKPQNS